jgi:hypothetical protein
MYTRILAIALLTASALTQPAAAAQFTRSADRLYVTGPINQGDDERFVTALDAGIKIVSLTSEGGYVREAMNIGRTIRQYGLRTEVPSGTRCVSACTLLWAGGRTRSVEGSLVFHCPKAPSEQSCSEPGRQSMVAYLREMGVSEKLVTLQQAAGLSVGIWAKAEDLAELVPAPVVVADGRDYVQPPDYYDEPPRRPRPRYYGEPCYAPPPPYYGPPPGWYQTPLGPVPCLPQLVGLQFCI